MNICFIIDDLGAMNPDKDTTLRLIHEAFIRDHKVSVIYPHNLTVRDNIAYGFVKKISTDVKVTDSVRAFYKKIKVEEQMLPLGGFDAIFIRDNPPLDNIMLNFLDSIRDQVFILNDINGLRKANNKLYTTTFDDTDNHFIPKTYVSKNIDYLRKVIENSEQEKMILKPLDGYGGSGVIVIEKSARQNLNSLLDFYINANNKKNYIIVQEYVEGAENGDIRVLILNGKPIGAYKRIPAENDCRANIHAGGSAEKYTLNKKERAICYKIGKKLKEDGIYFAGVDIINEMLIEVNVQSPGGIVNINKFNKTRLQKEVIDFIEEKVMENEEKYSKKESDLKRRQNSKAEVNNA